MPRFLSWLALAVAAAFLVVVSASFSLTTIGTMAFAISIGTLLVSAGIAVYDRRYVPSLITAVLVAVISAWTIVASLLAHRRSTTSTRCSRRSASARAANSTDAAPGSGDLVARLRRSRR